MDWAWQPERVVAGVTMLPGWAGGRVGRGRGHGAGVSGFWWGWQASVRRSCAQNAKLRLPSLPMWLRQRGGGGGWRALRRSIANRKLGLHWGALPPLGPTLREAGVGVQQWVGGNATTAAEDPAPLVESSGAAFLAQIGQGRGGVCAHLNLQEPSWSKGQLRGAPHPLGPRKRLSVRGSQELGVGAESSRRVRPNIGFSRIISGVYSGSISHKVAHSHWHTQAQRITLSHRHGTPWHSTQTQAFPHRGSPSHPDT